MRNAALLLPLLLAAPLALGPAAETAHAAPVVQGGKKGYHENGKYGFQFKPPKDWLNIALKVDEGWLGAKYRSDKSYFFTDDKTGYTAEHVPELLVVCFVKQDEKDRVKREKEEDGDEVITLDRPYEDYDDFLDRNFGGEGFFLEEQEETKLGKIPVTQYRYVTEKLSSAPKYFLTWVFHTEEVDYAIQIDVLQTEYKKLKRTLDRTFKSFELIERTGEDMANGATGTGWTITIKDLNAKEPKERRTKRMESEEALRERAVAGLPDDWEHMEVRDVLVLSHADKKVAKRFGEHAAAMIKYFEDTFPYVGKGEYARTPILRIFADSEELGSSNRGTLHSNYGSGFERATGNIEILAAKPAGGFTGYEIDYFNVRLLSVWLWDKDSDLYNAMPEWIQGGIVNVVRGARPDGRKMDFRENDYDVVDTKMYKAQGQLTPPRELIQMTREEYAGEKGDPSRETYYRNKATVHAFVRFLMSPDSRKCKEAEDFVERYITTLGTVVQELKDKNDEDWDKISAPKTEEEEEEFAKARGEMWQKREKELLQTVFERAFGDWGDEEWDSLHESFYDWL